MDVDLETLEEVLRRLKEKRRQSKHAQAAGSSSSDSERSAARPSAAPKLSKETQILLGNVDEPGEPAEAALQRQVEEAQRREEDVRREENTVFMTSLPLKAIEEDVYTFLKEHKVGPVRDIRIIRDASTKKSKGMAYVEFYSPESVQNAIALKKKLMGHVILIAPPYADKNRAHLNSRPKPFRPLHSLEPPSKNVNRSVLVKNLVGKLAEMAEKDIERLFAAFGQIEHIEMDFDAASKRNKGQAIVQFARSQCADVAIRKMNGFTVSGEPFIVSHLPAYLALSTFRSFEEGRGPAAPDPGAEVEVSTLLNPQLARTEKQMKEIRHHSSAPTKVLGLFNLFEEESVPQQLAEEVKRDVKSECRRFGRVEEIWLDRREHKAVFVRFAHKSDCVKAFEALHSRTFDKRPLICGYFNRSILDA